MNLGAFALLVLRRGWMPVVSAIVFAALGLAFAVAQVPVFEAVTRVAVRPTRPADLGQTQAIREVMNSYMQDIATLDMAGAVGVRLADDSRCAGYDQGPYHLLSLVRVGSDLNVYEIQIKARSRDSAEAGCVSEKWSAAFVDRREKANLQLDPLDRIVTEARDVTVVNRVWPRRRVIVLAAALFGAVLGGLAMLALEFLESGFVRSAEEASRFAGAPLLAVVPGDAKGLVAGSALRSSLRALRSGASRALRAALPVVLFAGLGAAAAFAMSRAQPEEWRARTRVAVEPARGSDWGQTQAIREIMKGYSEDVKTRRMAERVNAQLELDRTADSLLANLNVAPKEGVYEVIVDFRDGNADTAKAVSRAWATTFVEDRTRANLLLDQRDRILTRLRDETSVTKLSPRPLNSALAGAVIGAIVGAAMAFWLEYASRGAIRTAVDARTASGAPVLGAIPPASGRNA